MKTWHFVAVAVFCWAGAWLWWRSIQTLEDDRATRFRLAPSRVEAAAPPVVAAPRERSVERLPAQPRPSDDDEPDEESVMAFLRESLQTEPERTLEEARVAEARFGPSSSAPERAWLVARSLVNLRRFHEARAEAERAVREFPGTPWTVDLQRHLLVQPLDYPPREEQARGSPLAAEQERLNE